MRCLVWPIKYDYIVASDDLAVSCYNNATLNSDKVCITTFLIYMHSIWIFYFFTLFGPRLQETCLALVRQIRFQGTRIGHYFTLTFNFAFFKTSLINYQIKKNYFTLTYLLSLLFNNVCSPNDNFLVVDQSLGLIQG